MFLTLEDPNAKIKGSRDPLGIQPIWAVFGRHVVANLTMQTDSTRGFTILLLGRYLTERLVDEGRLGSESALDAYLRFEQIGAYVREAAHRAGGDIRGIERVRSRLAEHRGRVPISASPDGLILGDQKVNGLWGLFSVSARTSRLVPDKPVGLTPEAREFIECAYLPLLQPGMKSLLRLVAKDGRLDTRAGTSDPPFSVLSEVLSESFTEKERRFYGEYLRDGLHVSRAQFGRQRTFRRLLVNHTDPGTATGREDIVRLREAARSIDGGLGSHLDRIVRVEAVLAPVMSLFDFMLTCHRRELGALSQDAEPARLDYRRIDVRRKTGVFHPKLVFLLVDEPDAFDDDADERQRHQSLLVACLSANLSRAGWWENVECAHIEEISDRHRNPGRVPYRRDLLAMLRRIRACAAKDEDHRALDAVREFLLNRVSKDQHVHASAGGRWHTRFFGGEGRHDLTDWLAELRLDRHGDWNLEVISPYFDANGAGPLKRLLEVIRPRETLVYLPHDADGSALVTKDAYDDTADLDGVRWAELPGEITVRSGRASGERLAPRRVHAKMYRLWRRAGGDIVLVGSVNCTSAAHSHGGAGNLEAAFLVDVSDRKPPRRWWLKPMDRDIEHFVETASDEADGLDHPPFGVSIRYHWGEEGALAIRFEGKMELPIEVSDVSGRRLFTVGCADVDQWQACDRSAADAIRESLVSSSFVVMHREDASWRVLVREEGMAHRPSILSELSPDEILEYWSLLTAEERAAFIERHAAIGEEIEGLPVVEREPPASGDTLFDRFAGVFHAFGALHRNIEKALKDERHEEAEMRLLGAKYDSLPELLRKILEREDGDPVLGYVTFLTAR